MIMPEISHILNRFDVPFFSLDKKSAITYLNKKAGEFFGCNLQEMIGKKIDEIPQSSFFRSFANIYQEALTEQRSVCVQNYYSEKSVWLQHLIYPSEDGLTACVIDITKSEKVREEERINLSREIHDELGQQLTALMMDIAWLDNQMGKKEPRIRKKIDDINDLLNITVETLRKISTDLHPQILDDLGLIAGLEWQNRQFEKSSGIAVQFQCGIANPAFPSSIAICLFRIYQESLTNIARHAEAQMVSTALEWKDDGILLNITDNGKGFNTEVARLKGRSGLAIMKERAMQVGGQWRINSEPNKGTSITVHIPKAASHDQYNNS
ncbi:MAG: hypothetical protein C5B59_14325 [Bacteroidetes bacterium]|nr:MAG: hypothetical protein C5B59_14325 [Bacteroidota bacterium]